MDGSPERRTARLLLRAPQDADVDALFAIQGDAAAMQYTFCAVDREATGQFLRSHADRFRKDGYAPWTALLAEDGRVVGWGGLGKDPAEPQWGAEVVYFLDPAVWGRGLATELVRAALDHAFDDLGLDEVGAFARPANAASRRVLEKCGFERFQFVPQLERDWFVVRRAERRTASVR
jgi:ribosomal-protein-alanine N-acetyltransferase